jgi:hypothetical protein
MAYERKECARGALVQRTSNAAEHVNNVVTLRNVTASSGEEDRICIQADGGIMDPFLEAVQTVRVIVLPLPTKWLSNKKSLKSSCV